MKIIDVFKDPRPLMGQDPWLIKYLDDFYLVESQDEKRITISLLNGLHSPYRINQTTIWENSSEHQVWSPEIHNRGDYWYVFYSFSYGENHSHRTHILVGTSPFGPFGRYRLGKDIWGIDQTLAYINGEDYLIWSGWENNHDEFPQHLYIAPWSDPYCRLKISSPELSWEGVINEGPQFDLRTNSLLYSANSSWTQEYSTGVLHLEKDGDPLDPRSWRKSQHPLASNTGHAQPFEDRLIYHSKMSPFPGWTDRQIIIGAPFEHIPEAGGVYKP